MNGLNRFNAPIDYLENKLDGEIPTEMEELLLPSSLYVVFPNDIVNAWQRLYSEWLPTSGHELANQPYIENYLAPEADIEQELWVPTIAKLQKIH